MPTKQAARANRTSKLAPALAALLDQPLAPLAPPLSASRWLRSTLTARWREDRIAAAVLLVPTLLVASMLMLSPRQRVPLDQAPLTAAWRGVPPAAPNVAETPTTLARYEPPFLRPAERTTVHVPIARHDLDAVTPALSKDARQAVAMAGPPFLRPPERSLSYVPLARHDLDSVTPVLAGDAKWAVAMAGPPFVRPPERAAAIVPTAAHDLANVVVALVRDAETARAKLPPSDRAQAAGEGDGSPFTRTPEGTLLSVLPEAGARAGAVALCRPEPNWQARLLASRTEPVSAIVDDPGKFGLALAAAAKAQIGDLVIYNAKYMTIAYPGGDVPDQFGVCTDVVIRAYRTLGIDLQELVHLSRPRGSDASIDHRRTELLRQFFATHGEPLATSPYIEDYLPGDIVTYHRPQNRSSQSHIAVVTDVMAPSGRPMIAHNRGWGVQLEDALFVDQMTGHYRYRGPRPAELIVAAHRTRAPKTAAIKLSRTLAAQGAVARDAARPGEARPGSGRQAALQPPSAVQLATVKSAPDPGAHRIGLWGAAPPAAAGDRCGVPVPMAAAKDDRLCVVP